MSSLRILKLILSVLFQRKRQALEAAMQAGEGGGGNTMVSDSDSEDTVHSEHT
jgi:hypothetical protein